MKHASSSLKYLALAIGLWAAQASGAQAVEPVQELPHFDGHDYTDAIALSADGTSIAGSAYYNDYGDDDSDRAWLWTLADGYTFLQHLPSDMTPFSYAHAISGDGNYIFGSSQVFLGVWQRRAVRWTRDGTAEDISYISETQRFSEARGTNSDGTIAVGKLKGGGQPSDFAVIWGEGHGAEIVDNDLYTSEGDFSFAGFNDINNNAHIVMDGGEAVLSDDTVAVGFARTGGGTYDAARWTPQGGWEALQFNFELRTGVVHQANAVSDDGSVIVGYVRPASGPTFQAFRWTAATGGVALALPEGAGNSNAFDVSGDGNVAVGYARFSSTNRAVMWTENPDADAIAAYEYQAGYQTVEDWLIANGVTIAEDAPALSSANATNEDGTVISGTTENDRPFIATAKGFFDPLAVSAGLGSIGVAADMTLSGTTLIMHGAHSQPLMRRVGQGKFTAWTAGDIGRDDHGARGGTVGLVEIGMGYNFGPLQLNLSLGQTWSDQDLAFKGSVEAQGQYVFTDTSIKLWDTGLFLNIAGFGHWGDAEIVRGYLNAGVQNFSRAEPDTEVYGLRTRLDWHNVTGGKIFALSPYLEYSYTDAQMDAYTETGGGFPASVAERNGETSELRFGGNTSLRVARTLKLLLNAELAHRLTDDQARTSGRIIGVGPFNMPGRSYDQTWFKGGLGLDALVGPARFNMMVNGTTEGEEANLWLATSFQMAF